MKRKLFTGIFLPLILMTQTLLGQSDYQYNIDLTKLTNDELTVNLRTPRLNRAEVVYSFPKIIPGTYSIGDYGQFIKDLRAYDQAGKALAVKKLNVNQWQISNATKLRRISYTVSDIFDAPEKHGIDLMAATNFEEGKNFVLNMPGVIGFFEEQRNLPFVINFIKPQAFYASTSLQPLRSSLDTDVFSTSNVDELYDSPIMYSIPDTTIITVGNCKVLVSVYSATKAHRSKEIASWMKDLLGAASKYLGGKLPADRYSFLYYFRDPNLKARSMGALEHTTSSFYFMDSTPAERQKSTIVDVSSHEFFHIITPLTIASKEVKQFNFNEPVLSKHLWLYEGSTEYVSHYVQMRYGLKTIPQFLSELAFKTKISTRYNDTLPFTELSRFAYSKYAMQYNNVYEKGALISAVLDIYLLHLSNGKYAFSNLAKDLGKRYGKKKYFNDDELFDVIAKLTYPEIKVFFQKYVAGSSPIPYEYYFSLAGVKYDPKVQNAVVTFGSLDLYPRDEVVTVFFETEPSRREQSPERRDAFRKTIGFIDGDQVYAINGIPITLKNYREVSAQVKKTQKEGELLSFTVGRDNKNGGRDTLTLSAPAITVLQTPTHKYTLMEVLTPEQRLVRDAWLYTINNDDDQTL